ncbi:MAG TPA: catalase HPII, partial [Pararhizobium sp.]|nr:catalase HPII [Pararhizobium sp.]
AKRLRLKEMPKPADAARPTRTDLRESPKLSIVLNGPDSFKGRKLGVLVTDGADIGLVKALKSAIESEGAMVEFVAPMIGGAEASDGTWIEAKQKIDGGPSVLYDAIAVIASTNGCEELMKIPPAKDFVSDAFAHCKFIAYSREALPLMERAGVRPVDLDDGCVRLDASAKASEFVTMLAKLRFWEREAKLMP